jgi:hypothetical protein
VDALVAVVGGLVGLAIGIWLGIVGGKWSRARSVFWFWAIAALFLLAGVAIAAGGLQFDMDWLFVGGVSLMAGGLTAVKYASRRVPNLGG